MYKLLSISIIHNMENQLSRIPSRELDQKFEVSPSGSIRPRKSLHSSQSVSRSADDFVGIADHVPLPQPQPDSYISP